MASVKMTYDDVVYITHNGREVEAKVYATSWWYHSKATRLEPAYDETEVDEIEISDAIYTDTNEHVSADEIVEEVRKELEDNQDNYFSVKDDEDRYSGEMDCVDRWRVAHGVEV